MIDAQRCETCRYSRDTMVHPRYGEAKIWQRCLRYPTPALKMPEDWCGEWRAREDEPVVRGGVITDGLGNFWRKCAKRDCKLHVVRPGKVQCECWESND